MIYIDLMDLKGLNDFREPFLKPKLGSIANDL